MSCKVMLLRNKSNSLVNGSQGTFVGVRGDDVVVDFAEEGHVVVKKRHGQTPPGLVTPSGVARKSL